MRKLLISIFAIFAIVFASAFVFRDATNRTVTFSAQEINYAISDPNQYDFSYLKSDDIQANWQNIQANWTELKAQLQDSSFADYLRSLDFKNLWGSFNSNEFNQNVRDFLNSSNMHNYNYRLS